MMFHELVPNRLKRKSLQFRIRPLRLFVRYVQRNSARVAVVIILIQICYIAFRIHVREHMVDQRNLARLHRSSDNSHGSQMSHNEDYESLDVPAENILHQVPTQRRAAHRNMPARQPFETHAPSIKLVPLNQPKRKPSPRKQPPKRPKSIRKLTVPLCSMEERTSHVNSYCDKTLTGDERPANYMKTRYGSILVDEKHKIMFCDVPNVEGVLWSTFIARVTGGATHPHPPVRYRSFMGKLGLKFLDAYTNEERDEMLQGYFKFLAVRHPLQRLLLVWRQKMVDSSPKDTWRSKLGRQIILDQRKQYHNVTDIPINATVKFEEFLEFAFANRDMVDPNWFSYLQACHPCEIRYDAVLRSESMDHDADAIFVKYPDIFNPDVRLNYTLPHNPVVDILAGKDNLYEYDAVSPKAIEAVLRRYQHGMKMYGYIWDKQHNSASCAILSKSGRICC